MILLVDKIEKSFGSRTLFTGATLQVNAGERYALVGPNGAGKTTLLKIIMGLDNPDAGSVTFAKDTNVGYLEQETKLAGATSIIREVMDAAIEIKTMGERAEELQLKIAEAGESGEVPQAMLDEYGHVQDRFERLGWLRAREQCASNSRWTGFQADRFRAALLASSPAAGRCASRWQSCSCATPISCCSTSPPTTWTSKASNGCVVSYPAYEGAVLIVSHDRAFMDACVDHVAALENRRITTYTGNYSSYLKQREDNLEQMRAKRAAQEREIAHMQVFVDKFRYKPTKAAQAQERMRRIEQIKSELVILPEGHKHVNFKFPDPPRSGDMVIKLEDFSKRYGDKVLYEDANLTLYRGDRVALVGPNGAGKSTLLKMLIGQEAPTTGTRTLGTHVGVAYYAQHQLEGLKEGNTVLQEIDSVAPTWTVPQQRSLLGAFLFAGDDVDKRVGVLSGGERARLALAKMLVAPEALLCLDEPTNHLDIDSVDMLENALKSFPGTIVLISHDEHLVRSVANRVVDIRNGKMTVIDGDYEYYLYKREDLAQRAAEGHLPVTPLPSKAPLTNVESTAEPVREGKKTKEQRRAEAAARAELNRRLKGTKDKLKNVEAALEVKRARYDELMELMASEELYADQEKSSARRSGNTTPSSRNCPTLEDEWLELSTIIEEETARGCA